MRALPDPAACTHCRPPQCSCLTTGVAGLSSRSIVARVAAAGPPTSAHGAQMGSPQLRVCWRAAIGPRATERRRHFHHAGTTPESLPSSLVNHLVWGHAGCDWTQPAFPRLRLHEARLAGWQPAPQAGWPRIRFQASPRAASETMLLRHIACVCMSRTSSDELSLCG